MLQKLLTIIYSRVSSASQSLESQHAAAKRHLESLGLKENGDSIIYLDDHDVSATKLKMDKRPKLNELICLIKEGKVKTVVVYKRDRLARNFYEFVDIVKIFIKYGVEVIYTATDEPPFKNKLALEAFYGMFSQMEGQNISQRTSDARKQYPPSIYGFKKIKNPNTKTHYVINEDKKEVICSLFNDFSKVRDEEQFLEFLLSHKKGLKDTEQIFRILTNAFYCGHFESNNGYQHLEHVEPMITLDLYITCKSKVNEFKEYYFKKLMEFNKLRLVNPLCGECLELMKHRKENQLDLGYFVCSAKHKRISISVEELHESVTETVLKHIQSISVPVAQKVISSKIATNQKNLQKELKITASDYTATSLKLFTMEQKKKSVLSKCLSEIQALKSKYSELEQDLLSLQQLSREIKDISRLLTPIQHDDFGDHELQQLVELFIDKVLVFDTHIHIDLYFAAFTKEWNAS